MSQLNGRVFTRLQQYVALPADLQTEVVNLEEYLSSIQTELFGTHRTLTLKSVYGVRARPLLEKIEAWVKTHGKSEPTKSTPIVAAKDTDAEHHNHNHDQPTPPKASLNVGNYQTATTPVVPPVSDASVGAHIPHAKKLLDALVLKGFVTLQKEDKPDDVSSSATEDPEVKDSDLLVAVGKTITVPKNSSPTVWDLVDGAVFAGMLQRKAGLLAKLSHGSEVYVMVNGRLKNVTIFSTDLGREPLLQLDATSLKVALDATHFQHGVKLWDENATELFSGVSAHESDALIHALVAIGVTQDTQGNTSTPKETAADKMRHEIQDAVTTDDAHTHLGGVLMKETKTKPTQDYLSSQPVVGQTEQDKMLSTKEHTKTSAHTTVDQTPQQTTGDDSLLGKIGRFFSPSEEEKTPQSTQQKNHASATTTATPAP